ncbi:hypothetical protein [Halopiger xanaduensis]|uniref:Uncharacterized protein n=1 Tax=Halopiger xanaduensis (strain DSM 18323 / JCM 14033 / SH-6) TaxID=797210 RepID=F8D4W2_HALXS|nr:hypothetical protein [Halopiger xanaduensis]AEH37589.1 hypothetical protein Halxa_2973 [Halopiger xanaduensis SH-6]
MRLPSTTRTRERSARATAPPGNGASGGGLARKLLLLSLGLAAVVYAVSRYADVPDEFEKIPIGDRDEKEIDRSEEGPPTEDAKSAAESDADVTGLDDSDAETGADADATTDVIDDAETNVDITDEERSAEEISERADENIPEPGEMAVDEDVVDELVDEGTADSDEDAESGES